MNEKPKLGTIDSALVNCVSMLSALTELRVEDLAGWLDLYYQIRYLWEVAQGHVTDPQLIRKDELLPILEATVREALRGTARKAAETVQEKKKRKPTSRPESAEPDTSSTASGAATSDASHASRASGSSPQGEGREETAPKPGPWTLYKRKVFDRLQQARKDGYTIAQISACSGGSLSEARVMAAINAAQLRMEEWKALEAALDAVTLLQAPEGPAGA